MFSVQLGHLDRDESRASRPKRYEHSSAQLLLEQVSELRSLQGKGGSLSIQGLVTFKRIPEHTYVWICVAAFQEIGLVASCAYVHLSSIRQGASSEVERNSFSYYYVYQLLYIDFGEFRQDAAWLVGWLVMMMRLQISSCYFS